MAQTVSLIVSPDDRAPGAKSIDFVEALPRNEVGKVLKRLLREPCWKDQARSVA